MKCYFLCFPAHTLKKEPLLSQYYSIILTVAKHSSTPAAVKLTIESVLFSYSIPAPIMTAGTFPLQSLIENRAKATEGFNAINPAASHNEG